ncbi:MAG: hypothetical protein MK110_08680 [Fuerstiella sp.]|nr:hypothetical protein [Fuerstiella sp.]
MDLQSIVTDNQLAVAGCLVALGVCGIIAGLSFQFGAAGKKPMTILQDRRIHRIHPQDLDHPNSSNSSNEESRRAA